MPSDDRPLRIEVAYQDAHRADPPPRRLTADEALEAIARLRAWCDFLLLETPKEGTDVH